MSNAVQKALRFSLPAKLVSGELTSLRKTLLDLLDQSNSIELDATNVLEIDACGGQLLISLAKSCKKSGGGLSIGNASDSFLAGIDTNRMTAPLIEGRQ